MEAAALTRPPAWLERTVLFLIPPASREAVGGDLCETYSSAPQYALEALRTVPFVVFSQMRRNANLPALGLQAFLVFFCFGGFAAAGSPSWTRAVLPLLAILGLLLRDAYQATGRPSSRRAMIEAIAIPYGALLFSQIVTVGVSFVRHMGPDLPLWLRFGSLAPLMLPLLCLLRTGLIVKVDRPLPPEDFSHEEVMRDYRAFAQRVLRGNRIEAGALGIAVLSAIIFLRPYLFLHGSIGLMLAIVYGLAACYLLREGAVQPLPADADFLSLRVLYQRELARQQQLRRFLLWLWLAPLLLALHATLIEGGISASRSAAIMLGSAAAILLCFFIGALNREQGGWVQEKIDLLDRMREQCALEPSLGTALTDSDGSYFEET